MVKTITVRQTGTSVSATIPKEMAERHHIAQGDKLFAIDHPDGVLLTPYDPTMADAMAAYERVAKKHRTVLRRLAR